MAKIVPVRRGPKMTIKNILKDEKQSVSEIRGFACAGRLEDSYRYFPVKGVIPSDRLRGFRAKKVGPMSSRVMRRRAAS